jgi:hypothetical protein
MGCNARKTNKQTGSITCSSPHTAADFSRQIHTSLSFSLHKVIKYSYRTTPCQPYFLSHLIHVYTHINATYLRARIFQLVQRLAAVHGHKSIPGKNTSRLAATFNLSMELMHPPTQRVNGIKLAENEARLLW